MAARQSRVLRFHELGEPTDVLRLEQVEIPDPSPDHVRVRVLATGLNPADWELCRGFMPGPLPRGIGYDVAGVDDTTGERLFGTADFVGQPSAGAADVAILNSWYPIPDGLAPTEAATLPMVVQTAVWTLELMGVDEGSTLLVHGAGGMVGYAAVQIALRRGARVIATAGPTFAQHLENFGAQVTGYGPGMPDRVRELTKDVDLVLDTPRPSPGTLPDLIALAGGDPTRVMTISNHDEARELGARVNVDELRPGLTPPADFLPEYAELAARNEFRLPVARTFPLDDWREAVDLSLSGNPRGKLVLIP
ncbi:NADP-dependent oxidoreductase [Cryptosporangium phraense]|uniref:NADP-dependent oxidoreductase n=1 Tax=Cryptosporangium phraense TaxID=2593070 RepID=A0A545AXG2_9ACTN|nr:NADP-dependent oxidoreductase [Cryptosporangium phraense]TQS45285.1 NADP-dependent oxidoreductase [Cryptosporangium phraense]